MLLYTRLSKTASQHWNDAFFSHLFFGTSIDQSANANAGSTPEQIAAVMPQHANLTLAVAGEGAELDCGGRANRSHRCGAGTGVQLRARRHTVAGIPGRQLPER